MKQVIKFFGLCMVLAFLSSCQSDNKKAEEKTEVVEEKKTITPQREGQRNRRGYPIGTIQEATQLLAGAQAKMRELNRRMTEMMQKKANGADILAIGKPLDEIRPMAARMDSFTRRAEQGLESDFLSDRDLGKIEGREQKELDALIDSLSYLNSIIDIVLLESDKKIMEQMKKGSE